MLGIISGPLTIRFEKKKLLLLCRCLTSRLYPSRARTWLSLFYWSIHPGQSIPFPPIHLITLRARPQPRIRTDSSGASSDVWCDSYFFRKIFVNQILYLEIYKFIPFRVDEPIGFRIFPRKKHKTCRATREKRSVSIFSRYIRRRDLYTQQFDANRPNVVASKVGRGHPSCIQLRNKNQRGAIQTTWRIVHCFVYFKKKKK